MPVQPSAIAPHRYKVFQRPIGAGPWDQVRRAVTHPLFARLNYCKQLSTTNITLNIEATHSRLAHSLGTLDIAARIFQEQCLLLENKEHRRLRPTCAEATAIMLFALLHDAYHGPFGHSLDRIGSLILKDSGEHRIDKEFLKRAVRSMGSTTTPLHALIDQVAEWTYADRTDTWIPRLENPLAKPDQYANSVISFLALLIEPDELKERDPEKYWMLDLVDSPLDADRLDYLQRDPYVLDWVWNVPAKYIEDLLGGVRVIQGSGGDRRARLRWDSNTKWVGDQLLALRSDLYMNVYEAPEKRAFDEMLSHALVWIIRKELDPTASNPSDQVLSAALAPVVSVTDDELFHFLYEIGSHPRHTLAMALVHDVATGRPFQKIWELSLPFSFLSNPSTDARVKKLFDMFYDVDKIIQNQDSDKHQKSGMKPPENPTELVKDKMDELQRRFRFDDADSFFQVGYLMCLYCGRSFTWREALERMLWERLQVELPNEFKSSATELEAKLVWSCADRNTGRRLLDEIGHSALAFLSIPWVPPAGSRAALAGWTQDEGILWHVGGRLPTEEEAEVLGKADLPLGQEQAFYAIALYLPSVFAKPTMVEKCDKLLMSMIRSFAWIDPEAALNEKVSWWEY